MKIKNRGFTLVELLAVIVILAIIAVIAVPQVLKIIEGSRKDTFRSSIRSVIKAIQLEVVKDSQTIGSVGNLNIDNNNLNGIWEYNSSNGKITLTDVYSNNYIITKKIVNKLATVNEEVYSDNFEVSNLETNSGLTVDSNGKLIVNASESYSGTVVIPYGTKEIGAEAFSDPGYITKLIIPNGVEKIGERAFNVISASNIVIPNSVTTIGELCFNSISVEKYIIGSGLTGNIDGSVFGPYVHPMTIVNYSNATFNFTGYTELTLINK